jgi:subtilisin family serine protease
LEEYPAFDGLQLVEVPEGKVPEAVLGYLADSNVLNAEPDYERYPVSDCNSNDPYLLTGNYLWGLKKVRAPEAWCVNTGAPAFPVAVIDSGIGGYDHPDLAANLWRNPVECPGGTCNPNSIDDDQNGYIDDFYGWNFYNNNNSPLDSIPGTHGTHVAGIIGAVGNNGEGVVGMNWQVKLVVLKVWGSGGGIGTFVSRVLAALNYCVVNNIKVSNNSYIGSGMSVNECAAIQSAGDQIGHIFVAAAGNDGYDLDVNPVYPASCAKSQAGCSVCPITNIVTVTATHQGDHLACMRWTKCPPTCPRTCIATANYGDQTVHLGAPGEDIYSTVYEQGLPSYLPGTGTSMAAPHVTGAVALVWSRYPTWTYQQVRDLVLGSVHKNPLTGQTITGGRLDVAAALLDCNNNGVADGIDVNTYTSFDCNDNNVPDECESLGACCLPAGCIRCLTQGDCTTQGGIWHPSNNCIVCAMFGPQPGP